MFFFISIQMKILAIYVQIRHFLVHRRVNSLYAWHAAMQYRVQSGDWFFALPCDWRFLPELGPLALWPAGFFPSMIGRR
jgi:hypothetical protein